MGSTVAKQRKYQFSILNFQKRREDWIFEASNIAPRGVAVRSSGEIYICKFQRKNLAICWKLRAYLDTFFYWIMVELWWIEILKFTQTPVSVCFCTEAVTWRTGMVCELDNVVAEFLLQCTKSSFFTRQPHTDSLTGIARLPPLFSREMWKFEVDADNQQGRLVCWKVDLVLDLGTDKSRRRPLSR